jgi:ABC-type lipoprotein export system ATPase subunit
MAIGASHRRRASLHIIGSLAVNALAESPMSLLLLLLAVAAGVGFQVPNVANVAGYRSELLRQEVGSGTGEVRVRPRPGGRFRDAGPILERLRAIRGVTTAQPLLILPAALRNGSMFSLAQIVGVEGPTNRRPYELVEGQDLGPSEEKGVVMGTRLANTLGVRVGDDLELDVLLATRPRLVLDDNGVGKYTVRVRGLAGFNAVDQIFANRAFLAAELGDDGAASAIIVHDAKPSSLPLARRIAAAAEAALPSVTAVSWFEDSHALMGASGGGKTTLLHMLGLLDRPTRGRLFFGDREPWVESAAWRADLRLTSIGFVFQQSNLLPHLTARDNVALPAWRASGDRRAARALADRLLDRFGLTGRRGSRGGVLSLGEAQRVAIARALVNRPALLIADEPTGSLDSRSSDAVLAMIDEVHAEGTTVLMATHDSTVATRMRRQIRIHDGRLIEVVS